MRMRCEVLIAVPSVVLLLAACSGPDQQQKPTPTLTSSPTRTPTRASTPTPTATPDGRVLACRNSGGVTSTALCCATTGSFPDTCGTGACECPSAASHVVTVCQCGSDRCFDRSRCVAREGITPTHTLNPLTPTRTPTPDDSVLPCLDSGGTVSTGSCCLAVGDFPDTCDVAPCACPPHVSHDVRVCECGNGRCFNPRSFLGCVDREGKTPMPADE